MERQLPLIWRIRISFILCPRDIVLKEFTDGEVHEPLEKKLDDLIMKYRMRLTMLYDELDKTKEDDIFVKTELLETIISELGMIKNSKEQVKLKAGDYVEGYESYGQKEAYIRGQSNQLNTMKMEQSSDVIFNAMTHGMELEVMD